MQAEPEHGQADGPRRRALFSMGLYALVAGGLIAGLLLFYKSVYSVHQDLAGSALSGRLSVQLGESFPNYSIYFPPAERAWFSVAARLSDWSGLRLDLVVVSMTSVLLLFSTGLAYRIRRATAGATPWFLLASLAVLTILPILFKNVFGLREHLIILGLWPYLVLRLSDPQGTLTGWRLRLLVGVWMGAMLLSKYLYSAAVLLVELADAVIQRRPALLLRIENVIAGTIVAIYLFFWLVLNPAQRAAIAAVVSAIDANLADPTTNLLQAANHILLAVFLLLASRIFQVPARITALGLALVAGAIIAAWAQERWYSHHLFPIALAYIGWWWMAGCRFSWWGHAAVAIYLLVPVTREYSNTAHYQESVDELDSAMIETGQSVATKRVGILTMHPSPYNQHLAAHGGVRWNASMNNAYVAAELKPYDTPDNARTPPPPVKLQDPGRRLLHDEMLRLWEDMPPEILILDDSTNWPLRYIDVNWTRVFGNDPRFNAILRRYRPVLMHKGKKLRFKYYVREDLVAPATRVTGD
jgi:hypothetical protein